MKKYYEEPEVVVETIEVADVITTSRLEDTETPPF